jgi:hypothetical protein
LPAEPVVVGETIKFVVRVRSMSEKWLTLHEPMPNGTIWVYRPHVLTINPLPRQRWCRDRRSAEGRREEGVGGGVADVAV